MPSLFEKLQAKIEVFRLEQRYTRNRHRRSTFVSNAVYVDGEYIYQTPNTTGSSTNTSASSEGSRRRASLEESVAQDTRTVEFATPTPAQKKRLHRFSSIAGFSSATKASRRDWRSDTVDVREVR